MTLRMRSRREYTPWRSGDAAGRASPQPSNRRTAFGAPKLSACVVWEPHFESLTLPTLSMEAISVSTKLVIQWTSLEQSSTRTPLLDDLKC